MPSFLAIIVLNSDTIFKTKFRARINNSSHNVSPVIFAAQPLLFFFFILSPDLEGLLQQSSPLPIHKNLAKYFLVMRKVRRSDF